MAVIRFSPGCGCCAGFSETLQPIQSNASNLFTVRPAYLRHLPDEFDEGGRYSIPRSASVVGTSGSIAAPAGSVVWANEFDAANSNLVAYDLAAKSELFRASFPLTGLSGGSFRSDAAGIAAPFNSSPGSNPMRKITKFPSGSHCTDAILYTTANPNFHVTWQLDGSFATGTFPASWPAGDSQYDGSYAVFQRAAHRDFPTSVGVRYDFIIDDIDGPFSLGFGVYEFDITFRLDWDVVVGDFDKPTATIKSHTTIWSQAETNGRTITARVGQDTLDDDEAKEVLRGEFAAAPFNPPFPGANSPLRQYPSINAFEVNADGVQILAMTWVDTVTTSLSRQFVLIDGVQVWEQFLTDFTSNTTPRIHTLIEVSPETSGCVAAWTRRVALGNGFYRHECILAYGDGTTHTIESEPIFTNNPQFLQVPEVRNASDRWIHFYTVPLKPSVVLNGEIADAEVTPLEIVNGALAHWMVSTTTNRTFVPIATYRSNRYASYYGDLRIDVIKNSSLASLADVIPPADIYFQPG